MESVTNLVLLLGPEGCSCRSNRIQGSAGKMSHGGAGKESFLTVQDLWPSGSKSSHVIDPCGSLWFSPSVMMEILHHRIFLVGREGKQPSVRETETTRHSPEVQAH